MPCARVFIKSEIDGLIEILARARINAAAAAAVIVQTSISHCDYISIISSFLMNGISISLSLCLFFAHSLIVERLIKSSSISHYNPAYVYTNMHHALALSRRHDRNYQLRRATFTAIYPGASASMINPARTYRFLSE